MNSRPYDYDDHGNLRSWQPAAPASVDRAVRAGMYSAEFAKGRRDAKAGKSRFDCPYNGPDLRDGWFAGFDSVRKQQAG